MLGGGSRRGEAPLVNSTNVFAALGSLKKKKKKRSDKEQGSSKSRGSADEEPEKKEVFWAPAPLTAKSWADVDDEDDADYYATTAPPESVWGAPAAAAHSETVNQIEAAVEESESEEEGINDVEDDAVDKGENDLKVAVEIVPVLQKPPESSVATKETERQLSKKELKKKGLEELEAVLAELGYTQGESNDQDDSHGAEKKEEHRNCEEEKENATGESKSSRKKKKKDKSSQEQKESQDCPDSADNTTSEIAGTEKADNASVTDVKERLKKVASMKKKKSSKEMDAAARAAASEAAARSAKLAAAKKKEKAHYNQQPVR